jgi:DNA mismatch endonuclease (patch repair protein)
MADVHDIATRSYNMRRIRGKDTKPEMLVRKYLHANGLRYRLHNKNLPGKPDLTLSKYHTVIFVNGCFWHGHKGCKYFVIPKTRTEWWKEKIGETVIRDNKSMKELNQLGWNSIVIWECELKPEKRIATLESLYNIITKVEVLNYAQ